VPELPLGVPCVCASTLMRATLMYGAGDVRVEAVPDSDGVPSGYQNMADRKSLKVLIRP
jgi:hypothetical protein